MVSIDLGVVSDPGPEPPVSRPRPRLTARARRWTAAAVCLVLAGGLLGASARPESDALPEVRLSFGPTDSYYPAGDRLYVVGPHAQVPSAEPRTITAYSAPGGERLWQRPLAIKGALNGLSEAGDTLLLHVSTGDQYPMMVAVDAETAEPRWSTDAFWPVVMNAEFVVTSSEGSAAEEPLTWEALRTGTGERLWRREFPAGSYTIHVDQHGEQLMVVLPRGRAELWDVRANRMLAAVEAPGLSGGMGVAGRVALSIDSGPDGADVTAYTLPDLRPLWQREFADGLGLAGCGSAVICAANQDQDRTFGLDPATGEVLWENRRYGWYSEAGSLLLAEGEIQQGETSALIVTDSLVVVDARTGRTVKDFGSWQRIYGDTVHGPSRIVVAHFDREAGTGLVAEVDVDALSLRVLGLVHGIGSDCSVERDVMICRMLDGGTVMWDLPIAP
ncbi:outer membrane protein assembly factor BamB family protein [Catenuloplanes atrovinosus]|uniref:Outer membrane protein assembly factor BamB n=1 Tax=Catenuloplanes atrovinosus TaxID=137266 RepID=A0AAE4C768_9ACTN|nr:PQQ-binding-like beta-propeller repeat protein [Catenuloplanes atrovinosus]MDR7273523.1 outer membrane protein assembly factor BamB [Catenuloplanes atrovinosus]